jgi:hypothetical protein
MTAFQFTDGVWDLSQASQDSVIDNGVTLSAWKIPVFATANDFNKTAAAFAATTLMANLPSPQEAFGFSVFPQDGWISLGSTADTDYLYRRPSPFSMVSLLTKIFFIFALICLFLQLLSTIFAFIVIARHHGGTHQEYAPLNVNPQSM